MIKSFKQDWLEEFWDSGKHKRVSPVISKRLIRKLDMIHSAKEIIDLRSPPSNHLHKLHGDRGDRWAISVNGPWRLCFTFKDGDIYDLELVQLGGLIIMLPKNRKPTHPGEILRYEYLEELNMTQQQLADAIGITRVRVNEIVLRKRSVTPDTAFRLAKYFNTTPDFWMTLQKNYDMWSTLQKKKNEYEMIHPLKTQVA